MDIPITAFALLRETSERGSGGLVLRSSSPISRCLCILALLLSGSGSAQAQDSVPIYPYPFTAPEVANPDAEYFDHFAIQGTFRTPIDPLQFMLDSIDDERFAAIANGGDPESSTVIITVVWQRLSLADGALGDPISQVNILSPVVDLTVVEPVLVVLGMYTNDAISTNAIVGESVAVEANAKWKIWESDGNLSLQAKVDGIDGFKLTLEATAADETGIYASFDPVPFDLVHLSDGPGGSHPTVSFAQQYYQFPADLFLKEAQLKLPHGNIEILDVLSSQLRRNRSVAVKLH